MPTTIKPVGAEKIFAIFDNLYCMSTHQSAYCYGWDRGMPFETQYIGTQFGKRLLLAPLLLTPLLVTCLRDWSDNKGVHPCPSIVTVLLAKSGIDHVDDAVNGQGRFCNVSRQNHLSRWKRPHLHIFCQGFLDVKPSSC